MQVLKRGIIYVAIHILLVLINWKYQFSRPAVLLAETRILAFINRTINCIEETSLLHHSSMVHAAWWILPVRTQAETIDLKRKPSFDYGKYLNKLIHAYKSNESMDPITLPKRVQQRAHHVTSSVQRREGSNNNHLLLCTRESHVEPAKVLQQTPRLPFFVTPH